MDMMCPYCGSENVVVSGGGIYCLDCGGETLEKEIANGLGRKKKSK